MHLELLSSLIGVKGCVSSRNSGKVETLDVAKRRKRLEPAHGKSQPVTEISSDFSFKKDTYALKKAALLSSDHLLFIYNRLKL